MAVMALYLVANSTITASEDEQPGSLLAKILCVFIFLVVTMGFGLLPIRFPTLVANANILDIVNAFTGGVFLSAGILHILPESVERKFLQLVHQPSSMCAEWERSKSAINYPIPFVFVLLGYFTILLLERVAFAGNGGHSHGAPQTNDARLVDPRLLSGGFCDDVPVQLACRVFYSPQPFSRGFTCSLP